VFGCDIEFHEKNWVKTHAEWEIRKKSHMQYLRLNACFRKDFSKLIKILLKTLNNLFCYYVVVKIFYSKVFVY